MVQVLGSIITDQPPLPKGWLWLRFDQIARNVSDRIDDPKLAGVDHYVGLEHLDSDSLKIRRWGTPDDVEAQKLRFREGDIIFAKRRAYQRKVGVADFDGICSAHAFVFRGNDSHIVPELLPYFMQTDAFMDRAIAISKGSLSPTINWSDLAREEFALPTDPAEQTRIAELLRAADEAVEAWRDAGLNVKLLREIRMGFWFDVKRAESHEDWSIAKLDDAARLQTGVAVGKDYGSVETELRPYLRVANVQDGHLDLSVIKHLAIPAVDAGRYLVGNGDVLMNEGGDIDKLGRGAVWRGQIDGCLHQNHVFCIRPEPSKLLPEFLAFQAESSHGKAYFRRCAKKTTNLASMNSTQLRAFPLILTRLETQSQVVSELQSLTDGLLNAIEHLTLSRLIYKRLLTHLLTPPTEPSR